MPIGSLANTPAEFSRAPSPPNCRSSSRRSSISWSTSRLPKRSASRCPTRCSSLQARSSNEPMGSFVNIRYGKLASFSSTTGLGLSPGCRGQEPRPPVHEICRAVRRGGLRSTGHQRLVRVLCFLSGAQGLSYPKPARAGGGGIGQDRAVCRPDRGAAWMDTQLPWLDSTLQQRRLDSMRLLRQVPAITELRQMDPSGIERLLISRLAADVIDSGIDFSKDPKFTETMAHKIYYGPVYFRYDSDP